MSKETTPEEEVEETTPTEGSDFEDNSEMSDEAFLAKVNKIEGRNYKSIEAYEKSVKERARAFSEQGQQKKAEEKSNTTSSVADTEVFTELLLVRNPEAELVKEDLEQVAEAKYEGNLLKAYRAESWLQDKAKSLSEKEQKKKESEGKTSTPSFTVDGKKTKLNLSEADRAFMKSRGLTDEDIVKSLNQ